MSTFKIYVLLALCVGVFWTLVIWGVMADPQRGARRDCRIAEISPDFTPEMRQQCRELLRHKL
jgi:hypothetical protein